MVDLKESLKEEILLQTCPSNQTKLSFNDFQQHSNLENALSDEYMLHTVNFAFETFQLKNFFT